MGLTGISSVDELTDIYKNTMLSWTSLYRVSISKDIKFRTLHMNWRGSVTSRGENTALYVPWKQFKEVMSKYSPARRVYPPYREGNILVVSIEDSDYPTMWAIMAELERRSWFSRVWHWFTYRVVAPHIREVRYWSVKKSTIALYINDPV